MASTGSPGNRGSLTAVLYDMRQLKHECMALVKARDAIHPRLTTMAILTRRGHIMDLYSIRTMSSQLPVPSYENSTDV